MHRSTRLFAFPLVIALTITALPGLDPGSNHLSGGIPPELDILPNLLEFTASPGTTAAPFTGCADVTSTPAAECEALVVLYDSTDGDNWDDNTNWKQNNDPCTWYGVTCSEGHVSELALYRNDLNGAIPPELGGLSNLERLYLWGNQLSGAIPPELGGLSNLERLYLGGNDLSGGIPPELGRLSNLAHLSLDDNQLSGAIPPELGGLSNLEVLDLSYNQLSGAIPPELGGLSNLERLSLDDNQLSGAIPPELGGLSNLERLSLDDNQLSGAIPPELGGLSNLSSLLLSNNALSGDIPPTLTNLVNLRTGFWEVDFGYNALTASNPALVAFLDDKDPDWADTQTVPPDNLAVAGASHERITLSWTPILYTGDGGYYEIGVAPSPEGPYTVHGTTTDKRASDYTVNGLASGPTYYFRVRTFTPAHDDQQNDLWSDYTAAIPGTTTGMPFTGCAAVTPIPAAECEVLVALYNSTDGPGWRVNTGWKQSNQPCTWYGVTCSGEHVSELDLSRNNLSGGIPPELGGLSNLQVLNLWSNRLSGAITPELGRLSNLSSLWLSNNALSGDVPPALTNLVKLGTRHLAIVDFGYNALTASNPALVAFLDNKDPDWADTQTVPPDDLAVASASHESVTLSWDPIRYTGDEGYYEASYATSPDGPYTVHGTTADKRASGYTVDGLAPETTYYFRVRTFTPAHDEQQNALWSGYTAAIPGTTAAPFTGCADVTSIPAAECEALVALYSSAGGDNWDDNTNWKQNNQPCTWYGVTCSGEHVSELDLSGNDLSGSIPPELGGLSNLERLNLWSNQLTGAIPPELGRLSNLEGLSLGDNQLSGAIPPELDDLSNLGGLSLSNNQLSGGIPPELGRLSNLQALSLYSNQLSGGIPPELGELSSLEGLYLANNQLSGGIPPELGHLSNLKELWLAGNQLTGAIPPELGRLSNLWVLSLGNNALSGDIPPTLTNLTWLGWLDLDYNALTASDPALIFFLNYSAPGWADTQTVPPADLAATATGGDLTSADITLTWTPILYTGDGGYYEISVAPSPEGPYTVVGTTGDKMANSYTIGGLDIGATPYLLVRTFTPAHDDQQNDLWSLYTYVLVVLPES